MRQVQYTYDQEGHQLSRTGSAEAVTKTYDAAYRVISLKDGNNNAKNYQYDTAERLTKITFPDGHSVQFTQFDAADRVLEREDGNGAYTTYEYNDPGGLLTNVHYPQSGNDVTYAYDADGRRTGMTDGTGVTGYTYDELGNPLTVTTTYTGLPAKEISYTYNPDGSRATMTHPTPSGYGTETYHYDAARRLISLINYLNRTSSWTYQDNNWLQQQTLGNGAYTTYTRNALGQLVGMTNYSATATAFSVYSNFAYDGAQNLTALTASVPGLPTFSGTTAYTYDTKNQLLEEQSTCHGGYDNTFGYDDAGNPTTFEGLTHTYNTSNELTDLGYAYDGNGNPTTYQGYTLVAVKLRMYQFRQVKNVCMCVS